MPKAIESKMVWERKQTFYPISNLYKKTNLQIRLSFPRYIVLFVILFLFFFTAYFQATKGIKVAIV